MLATLLLAISAFASTNVDGAVLLLAFFGDPALKARHVVIGQYAGMIALTVAAIVIALVALAVPDRYIGLLGIFPLGIGLIRLWALFRGAADEPDVATKIGAGGAIATVTVVTVANGADNIAVYVPLFAKQGSEGTLLVCAVFAVMTGIWCAVGYLLASHRDLAGPIQRWGAKVVPFVLIAIGLFILARAA